MSLHDRILSESDVPLHEGYVIDSILKVNSQLDTAMGGLNYRLYGSGKKHWSTDEPTLSPQDKKKAAKAYKLLNQARKLTGEAWHQLRNINLQFT